MTEYIYRVTRHRPNPDYYQSGTATKVVTRRALSAVLKVEAEDRRHAARYGTEQRQSIVKIERAAVGEWQEVTADEL